MNDGSPSDALLLDGSTRANAIPTHCSKVFQGGHLQFQREQESLELLNSKGQGSGYHFHHSVAFAQSDINVDKPDLPIVERFRPCDKEEQRLAVNEDARSENVACHSASLEACSGECLGKSGLPLEHLLSDTWEPSFHGALARVLQIGIGLSAPMSGTLTPLLYSWWRPFAGRCPAGITVASLSTSDWAALPWGRCCQFLHRCSYSSRDKPLLRNVFFACLMRSCSE